MSLVERLRPFASFLFFITMSSASSQKPLDGTPAERLTHHLQSIRERLLESDVYLGKPNNVFLKNLSWERLERGYQLVATDSDTNETGE